MTEHRATSARWGAAVALLLLTPFAAACGVVADSEGRASQGSATVEADLYSGRENPRWSLGTAAVNEVVACLSDAAGRTPLDAEPERDAGLGFRGYLVSGAALTSGGVTSLRVTRELALGQELDGTWFQVSCPGLFGALEESAPPEGKAPKAASTTIGHFPVAARAHGSRRL